MAEETIYEATATAPVNIAVIKCAHSFLRFPSIPMVAADRLP